MVAEQKQVIENQEKTIADLERKVGDSKSKSRASTRNLKQPRN